MKEKTKDMDNKTLIKSVIILFILSIIIALQAIELDYSVYSPGGLINVDERLSNAQYKSSGSFNMTYVTYRKGSIFNLIIAKLIPTFDIVPNSDITLSNEDMYDIQKRDEIQIKGAISTATYMAFTKANKDVNLVATNTYIYYIAEGANTNLKVGDKVLTCDNNTINEAVDVTNCVQSHEMNEDIHMKVLRNNKEVDTVSRKNEENLIGIVVQAVMDYETDPNITYKREKNESGSSGGLLLTLSIYNSLVEEDITKGKKIAGTGTIEYDGSVGAISGVKYKIKGAVKNKVDLFIVPEANYEEAKQVIEENNFNLKLLKASTFDQVLEDLKSLN